MKKTISNTQQLVEILNLKLTEKEEKQIDFFFKKKVMHIINNKITYPKIDDIRKKENESIKQINDVEKQLNYWKKTKLKVERDRLMFPVNIYFKKDFWRHKIKKITNKEYKQDVIDAKLTDKILLDPEYKNLFETFLVNPDYRNKLKETINNSIVYKHSPIGEYSERKKVFKIKTSNMKMEQLTKQLNELNTKKEIYSKIIEIMKKNS